MVYGYISTLDGGGRGGGGSLAKGDARIFCDAHHYKTLKVQRGKGDK